MKERVTLTIDKDLLEKIDERIDGSAVKNRSHAVELLVRGAIKGSIPIAALILAGGKQPQALRQVQGKSLLRHNLDLVAKHGIKKVVLAAGCPSEQLTKETAGLDLQIAYVEEQEHEPLGTAGPILKAIEHFDGNPFIVLNADEVKDINLEKLYAQHVKNHGLATIALTTAKETEKYGTAMLDGNRITRFVEKPQQGESQLINAGCYVFEPEVVDHIPQGFSMLEVDVFPKLARDGQLYGYLFSGEWMAPR